MKSDISLTISTNPVEDRAKCHTYLTLVSIYPLQDWWRIVNEMSNFIFHPVDHLKQSYQSFTAAEAIDLQLL